MIFYVTWRVQIDFNVHVVLPVRIEDTESEDKDEADIRL